eukprot:864064_1
MTDITKQLKKLDIFRTVPKDLTEATGTGAFVSVVCSVFVFYLFMSEFLRYMTIRTESSMFVESLEGNLDNEKLEIHLDMTMSELPCAIISLDLQDVMGSHHVDVGGTLEKVRLDSQGRIMEENGQELISQPSLSTEQAKLQKGEGCRLRGFLRVNKVPGNFHISAHAHRNLISELIGDRPFNVSHSIRHMSFGGHLSVDDHSVAYAPLNGITRIAERSVATMQHVGHSHEITQTGSYEYYLKIVATISQKLHSAPTRSYQFTAHSNTIMTSDLPAVYFRYDFSPITVQFTQESESFSTFIIDLFAIIGGVFTAFSLVSVWLNISVGRVMRKINEGKLA